MNTVAELHSRIQHLRSHQWRIVLWTGLCKTLAAAVLLFLLYFLTDWLFDLPWPARVLTVLLAFGVLGLTAWRSIWVELRRIGDSDAMALKLEAHNPELRGRLISTLQLSRASTAGTYVASPQLLEALEAETLRMSAPLDFTSVVSRELLLRFGIAGVTVVAVQVVLMARFPDYFKALGARLVDPTAQFPTRTRVSETKVPDLVARGENIPIEILLDEAQVSFSVGEFTLTSRLIEGEFPNYRQLLPEGYESRLAVSRQGIMDAVRRVGLLARDTSPVRMEFNALGVKLSSSSPDLGQAVEAVEARYEGEDLTVAFNAQYLIDGLAAATGETVRIEVRDGLKPGVVRGDSDAFTYLVMPVRLPAPVG